MPPSPQKQPSEPRSSSSSTPPPRPKQSSGARPSASTSPPRKKQSSRAGPSTSMPPPAGWAASLPPSFKSLFAEITDDWSRAHTILHSLTTDHSARNVTKIKNLIAIYEKVGNCLEQKKGQFSGTSDEGAALLLVAADCLDERVQSDLAVTLRCAEAAADYHKRRNAIDTVIEACARKKLAFSFALQSQGDRALFRQRMTPIVQFIADHRYGAIGTTKGLS